MSRSSRDLAVTSVATTRGAKKSRLNQVVQARSSKKQPSEVTTVAERKKSGSSGKGGRVTARNRTTKQKEKTGDGLVQRKSLPRPTTTQQSLVKSLPKKQKRKSSKDSKPSPFGGRTAHRSQKRIPTAIINDDASQLRFTTVSSTTIPLAYKRITIG